MDDPMDGFDSQLLKEIEDHDNNYEKFDSSSETEIDEYIMLHSTHKNHHLFGRQKPLHLVLGGEKPANIILWRNTQISARIFAIVTVIWFLFECLGYHLHTFVCHSLILSLATVFLWSNLASYINVSPKLPDVTLPDELFVSFLLLLRSIVNRAFTPFQEVASGKDLKKLLKVIVVLWVLSVIGSWFSFLTFLYPLFVMLMTLPKLYERNEDAVDIYAEKWWFEAKKQFAVLNEYMRKKIPIFGSQKYHTQH